jgi:23S rRNA pseudouridine1911/1915/1917 synthase
VTLFEVVELLGPRALLDVTLETGRTHQIRVHLEAIELPDLRRSGLRRVRRSSSSSASFSMPDGWRSTTRSPPSGSRSSRRCPEDLAAALERARALA